MSEEEKPKAKRKLGLAMKAALLAVIDKKKITDRVGYKTIAAHHGVDENALRHAYSAYTRGEVDLGPPGTLQERQIDMQAQHAETVGILNRYQALVLNAFDKHLIRAEDAALQSKKYDPGKSPLPLLLRELGSCIGLRERAELAHERMVKEIIQRNFRENEPKPVQGTEVPKETQQKPTEAAESQRALAALSSLGKPIDIQATSTPTTPAT